MIENDCIVTRVGVYDEISPEPSSRYNTVTWQAELDNEDSLVDLIEKKKIDKIYKTYTKL